MEQMTLFDNEIRNQCPVSQQGTSKESGSVCWATAFDWAGKDTSQDDRDRSGNIYDILGTTRSRQDHIGWYNSRKDKSEFH